MEEICFEAKIWSKKRVNRLLVISSYYFVVLFPIIQTTSTQTSHVTPAFLSWPTPFREANLITMLTM